MVLIIIGTVSTTFQFFLKQLKILFAKTLNRNPGLNASQMSAQNDMLTKLENRIKFLFNSRRKRNKYKNFIFFPQIDPQTIFLVTANRINKNQIFKNVIIVHQYFELKS